MNRGVTQLLTGAGALSLLGAAVWLGGHGRLKDEPVRVGVLHSRSGVLAGSEEPVVEATLLAVEELNAAGGVLGRRVEPVVADGESVPERFGRAARRLIQREGVVTIFGCWTSASRKAVLPVVEGSNHLLVYPMQFEGLEESPAVVYTGSAPNQVLTPAAYWVVRNLGRRVYLVGTPSYYTRASQAILGDQIRMLDGETVGAEEFDGDAAGSDVRELAKRIERSGATAVVSTLDGHSAAALVEVLRERGKGPERLPAMLVGLSEAETAGKAAEPLVGHYSAWSYFESLGTAENQAFVKAFRARYGAGRAVGDAMQTAYFGVKLWAEAVKRAGSTEPKAIREAMAGRSWQAPEGAVYVDPETRYTWRRLRIGRLKGRGQFEVKWETEGAIEPTPYPGTRSRGQWREWLAAETGVKAMAWRGGEEARHAALP